jgi:GABA(A) receptor-associated protein
MYATSYKQQYSIERRLAESTKIMEKYPDRIPVICEKSKSQDLPRINKTKYLVPSDLTVAQFVCVIRNRMRLPPEFALFCLVDGNIPSSNSTIGDLYQEYKYNDGFLYIEYTKESVFG